MKTAHLPLFSIILISWISADLLGQGDTSQPALFSQPVIMYVGHFNPDCVPDTLIGFYQQDLRVRPAFLCWGVAFDSTGTPLCDSGTYDARMRASTLRDTTRIEYPDWDRMRVNVSILRFNTNDTLSDLIFWTRGTARAVVTQDGLELRDSAEIAPTDSVVFVDTARSLVIFGQIALSAREYVKLKNVRGAQSSPFAAMQLGYAVDLIEPKRRDHSGKLSWKMKRLTQRVDTAQVEDSTSAPPPGPLASVQDPDISARVYPNPAIYSTNIDVRPLPSGTYTVELIAADGDVVESYELELVEEGHVLETLDLTLLSSGHYFVRVRSGNKSFGDFPIIVVR